MTELTIIEQTVLRLIPKGSQRKRPTKEIADLVGLDQREVRAVISSLIRKGVPIVASRKFEDRGFYIATNNRERAEGLHSIKEQVNDMSLRIELVEQADLENWDKEFKQV